MRRSPVALLAALSCGHSPGAATPPSPIEHPVTQAPEPAAQAAALAWTAPGDASPAPAPYAWIALPRGGAIEGGVVTHTVQPGQSLIGIAQQWVRYSDVYWPDDLATEILKANPKKYVAPGVKLTIPHLLKDAPPPPTRLTRTDEPLRGIFLIGAAATRNWVPTLDRLVARGWNAVVLDGKDYMGPITYPSKVAQAVETGAQKNPPLPDLARTIRFAHERGIRVIMRISCFHDPWAAEKAPRLSVRGNWGGPYPIGWLDPANPEVHEYIHALMVEQMDAGADEINLDYVRYPVQKGLGNADFKIHMNGRNRKEVIRDFVHASHELAKSRGVPLSLDVFGVAATGNQEDIDNLGQDLAMLKDEAEFVMPMVYPSHYDAGFMGWDSPGDHTEIVGFGTRAAAERMQGGTAKVRPWLQAMSYKSPTFGPKYIADEIKSAEDAGAAGWMMWNPGSEYSTAWAIPIRK